MEKKNEPGTPSDLLDCLIEFLAPGPEESVEDLRTRLKDEGVDPDRVVTRVRKLVEAKLKEDRLGWQAKAQRERARLSQRLAAAHLPLWTREEMFTRLREILAISHGGQQACAHFRNFEKITDADLRTLLEDYDRMTEMEKEEHTPVDGTGDADNGRG